MHKRSLVFSCRTDSSAPSRKRMLASVCRVHLMRATGRRSPCWLWAKSRWTWTSLGDEGVRFRGWIQLSSRQVLFLTAQFSPCGRKEGGNYSGERMVMHQSGSPCFSRLILKTKMSTASPLLLGATRGAGNHHLLTLLPSCPPREKQDGKWVQWMTEWKGHFLSNC